MNPTPAVSRAPTVGVSVGEAPPQAARSALDAEHGGQTDQRVKGRPTAVLATHPSVPSPVGKGAHRAQGSRVPVGARTTMKHDQNLKSAYLTAESLLKYFHFPWLGSPSVAMDQTLKAYGEVTLSPPAGANIAE